MLYVPRDGNVKTGEASDPEKLDVFFDRHARDLAKLVEDCRSTVGVSPTMTFVNFDVLSYFKFYSLDLEDSHEENFYLEREWRMIGNLNFELSDIRRVFVAKGFAEQFSKKFPSLECVELAAAAA